MTLARVNDGVRLRVLFVFDSESMQPKLSSQARRGNSGSQTNKNCLTPHTHLDFLVLLDVSTCE